MESVLGQRPREGEAGTHSSCLHEVGSIRCVVSCSSVDVVVVYVLFLACTSADRAESLHISFPAEYNMYSSDDWLVGDVLA